ncbi:MAG TPA: hypothetical protein VE591_04570 [Candidatus Acidoferrum sp.]|nr:hypothetical protein [Candidatus Acidoferrum sp.]
MQRDRDERLGPEDDDEDLRETSTRTADRVIPSSYGDAGGLLPEDDDATEDDSEEH